jgi:hypothetical protein
MMADAASLSAPNPPVLGGKQMNGTNRSGCSAAWASYVLAASLAAMSTTALAQEADYEIWALDQGTHMLHIYDDALEEVDRIDLGAESIEVPHMISFTPDHSHAVIASTRSGDVTVIRTGDRKIVASIKTGPGTHMAGARPDGGAIIADVIGAGDVPRDGKVVEITAGDAGSFTLGRELVIAEDPLFVENESRFNDVAAICHDFSADGRYARAASATRRTSSRSRRIRAAPSSRYAGRSRCRRRTLRSARRRASPSSTSPSARWSRRCNRTPTTRTAIFTASASG